MLSIHLGSRKDMVEAGGAISGAGHPLLERRARGCLCSLEPIVVDPAVSADVCK